MVSLRFKLRKNQSLIEVEKLVPETHSLEFLGDNISKLPNLDHLKECRYLLIICPELEELPSLPPNIEVLKIKGGHFRLENIKNLERLKTLSVQGIGKRLISCDFPKNLETLDLSANGLEDLPPALFSLYSLRRLNLDNNQLKELPLEFYSTNALNHISLDGNPLSPGTKQKLYDCFGIWF